MKRIDQTTIVSVILLAEQSPTEQIHQQLQNIVNQTYKNLDIIVSYKNDYDVSSLISKWNETSYNIRWIPCNEGLDLLNIPLSKIIGEYVFYKTVNPIIWMPRHIEHHLELFKEQKNKALWSYSFLEYRNINEQNLLINVIGYRINTENIPKEQILLDELVHHSSLTPEWEKCIVQIQNTNQITFLPGMVFQNWKQYRFVNPTERTITQWINPQNQQQIELGKPTSSNNVNEEVIELDNGELGVKIEFPTIVGNIQYKEHNNKIFERIKKVDVDFIKSIAVKRTIGMGDVLLVEPVIRALKNKYQNAKITMFVGNSRGANDVVNYFKSKPDSIISIDENLLIYDYLYTQKGFDLRFDLDLSYESHLGYNYIDAYFETCGFEEKYQDDGSGNLEIVKYVKDEEKIPQLEYNHDRIINDKYIVAELFSSNWGGKQFEDQSKWLNVILRAKELGYKIVFLSNINPIRKVADVVNDSNDFNLLLNYIKYSEFFIGTDCGSMHIATAFNKRCFIINGAVLSNKTSYSKNIYQVFDKNLTCLHCKGRQFYNDNGQNAITFVAKCELQNEKQYSCMKNITSEYLLEEFNKFIEIKI